jgi:hypothetical protein
MAKRVKATTPSDDITAAVEYETISHQFAAGFQTMAVLLTLFFVFTGAIFAYLAAVFDNPVSNIHVLGFTVDFRMLQIVLIAVLSCVFTFWSLSFVWLFSEGWDVMLKRATQLETLTEGRSHRAAYFSKYWDWYSRKNSWREWLSCSTKIFFALIYFIYAMFIVFAVWKIARPDAPAATANAISCAVQVSTPACVADAKK